jgi:phage virion morphogenesis protein
MAILRIQIRAEDLERRLGQIAQRASNMRPAYQAIGNYLVGETQDRIKRETSPDGTRFQPLAAATVRRKAAKGKIRKILQEEGNLVGTIAAQVHGAGVAIGSNLPYAAIHQYGGKAGRGRKVTIPARPYLGVSEADEQEILGLIEDHLLS